MGYQLLNIPGRSMTPMEFRVIAGMSRWPEDEQEMFVQAVEHLAEGRITIETFESVTGLLRSSKLSRAEAFAFLADLGGQSRNPGAGNLPLKACNV